MLISLLGYTGRVSGQESVTITQCYEWARANYPQIHQMGLIDQTERYSLSNVGKAWLPQLSVSGKASYQSDVTKLPLDGDKISSLLPGFEIPSLSKDQYQVVAQVDQTIWDGGSTRSARALTRAEAIANREQLESELYVLNDRVNQIYFGCLLQDELIRQNALLQKELQVNIERIEAMMENGVANQSDLESMEVELLNAKLSFSVAIIHDPKIVFLDEPTGGVDPVTRRQFWELIYEAAARGITIFVTTHYMDEAEYCNRVSIMVDGKIEALDSPSALKRDFKTTNMNQVFHALARKATRGE